MEPVAPEVELEQLRALVAIKNDLVDMLIKEVTDATNYGLKYKKRAKVVHRRLRRENGHVAALSVVVGELTKRVSLWKASTRELGRRCMTLYGALQKQNKNELPLVPFVC